MMNEWRDWQWWSSVSESTHSYSKRTPPGLKNEASAQMPKLQLIVCTLKWSKWVRKVYQWDCYKVTQNTFLLAAILFISRIVAITSLTHLRHSFENGGSFLSCFQICTILYSFWDVHLALNGHLGCCCSVVVKPLLILSSFVGWMLWVQVQQGMLFRLKQHRAMCCMKWHYSKVIDSVSLQGAALLSKREKRGFSHVMPP